MCLSVCPSVTALAASASAATNDTQRFVLGFSWIMCGNSKKLSVQKLWREKSNMQISWSSPRAVSAHFRDRRSARTTCEGQLVDRELLPSGGSGKRERRCRHCIQRPTGSARATVHDAHA